VVLRAGQYLLSEMPMTALALWSVHALLRFCDRPGASRFIWFAALVAASVYAKQLAILMLPVYFTILVVRLGWRRLLTRRALAAGAFAAALILPMAVMTVALSPANLAMVVWNANRLVRGHRNIPATQLVVDDHLRSHVGADDVHHGREHRAPRPQTEARGFDRAGVGCLGCRRERRVRGRDGTGTVCLRRAACVRSAHWRPGQ
jgi:4-amino-4-deoxy-L-arabinose transferase-like glycosyltransferase